VNHILSRKKEKKEKTTHTFSLYIGREKKHGGEKLTSLRGRSNFTVWLPDQLLCSILLMLGIDCDIIVCVKRDRLVLGQHLRLKENAAE
jgi:hypothetical protein